MIKVIQKANDNIKLDYEFEIEIQNMLELDLIESRSKFNEAELYDKFYSEQIIKQNIQFTTILPLSEKLKTLNYGCLKITPSNIIENKLKEKFGNRIVINHQVDFYRFIKRRGVKRRKEDDFQRKIKHDYATALYLPITNWNTSSINILGNYFFNEENKKPLMYFLFEIYSEYLKENNFYMNRGIMFRTRPTLNSSAANRYICVNRQYIGFPGVGEELHQKNKKRYTPNHLHFNCGFRRKISIKIPDNENPKKYNFIQIEGPMIYTQFRIDYVSPKIIKIGFYKHIHS